LETGITVAFDSCLTSRKNPAGYFVADILVGMIEVTTIDSIGCCAFFPIPDPAAESRRIEGLDCNNNTVLMHHEGVTFNFVWGEWNKCGVTSVPYGEYPLSGSEVARGIVTLDWDCGPSAGTNLGEFRQDVYFGTDPNQLVRIGYHAFPPYDVGPLNPNQTYYWQVCTMVDFGGVCGPIWTFTTSRETPVKSMTWGGLKTLWKKE
jgi:hypothetical protein